VVDILTLDIGLIDLWVYYTFCIFVRALLPGLCQLYSYSTYVTIQSSSWIIMIMTIERFISVCFPLKAVMICTKKWTVRCLCISGMFIMILNSHILYFYFQGHDKTYCNFRDAHRYLEFYAIWYWIDMAMKSGVPFTVIVMCNFAIIVRILHRKSKFGAMESTSKRSLSSITPMLLTVSTVFVLCTMPDPIFYIVWRSSPYFNNMSPTPHINARLTLIRRSCKILQYSNNAVNFLLYCFTGSKFRARILVLISAKGCRQ
jgi:hypothetical protein